MPSKNTKLHTILASIKASMFNHKLLFIAWVILLLLGSLFVIKTAFVYLALLVFFCCAGWGYLQSIRPARNWKDYPKHIGLFFLSFLVVSFTYNAFVLGCAYLIVAMHLPLSAFWGVALTSVMYLAMLFLVVCLARDSKRNTLANLLGFGSNAALVMFAIMLSQIFGQR